MKDIGDAVQLLNEEVNSPEDVDHETGRMFYPTMPGLAGDGRETADVNTMVAHMFGHTPIGRSALGLPTFPRRTGGVVEEGEGLAVTNEGPSPGRIQDELRAVREFENPYRRSKGLPRRTTYNDEGDVYGAGVVK